MDCSPIHAQPIPPDLDWIDIAEVCWPIARNVAGGQNETENSSQEVLNMRAVTRKSGFTLVEILIVVIILGILAAIVIPQFTNASQDARESSLLSQLQTLRSQIELYKLQHRDALPNLVANWDPMTSKTDVDGTINAAGEFGPYMQAIPSNPVNGDTAVTDGDGSGAASGPCGFIFDYNGGNGTGRIWGTDTDKTTKFVE
jgi:general secretion pathway protein G